MTDTLPLTIAAKTLGQIADTEHVDALLVAADLLMTQAHLEQEASCADP